MPEQPEQSKGKSKGLTLENLKDAVRSVAALRLRVKLAGTGGDGDKIFPPTYAGGVYAVEDRRIGGKVVRCAVIDSVQSQANRMEEALLDAFLPAWRELEPRATVACDLPLLAVHVDNHGWVNSLTAPHRVHDAILRDSEIQEERTTNGKTKKERVRFRESTIGRKIVAARLHDAAAFYEYCPTALIFGTWDSTEGEGLDAAKIPRAIVSEIVGVDITPGVRTASRIDPLGTRAQSATVYRLKDDENDWTIEESEAARTDKGDAKKIGKGKPSDNPPPDPDPDVAPFLHGRADTPADVLVVWRADLEPDRSASWRSIVSAMPPVTREALPVPIYGVRAWLLHAAEADIADVEGTQAEPDDSPAAARCDERPVRQTELTPERAAHNTARARSTTSTRLFLEDP